MPENTPEYVSYHGQNRLLIIGRETDLDRVLARVDGTFRLFWLADSSNSISKAGVETLKRDDDTRLSGFLGQFQLNHYPDLLFDQVLDFQQPPSIDCSVPPFGYHAITDNHSLDTAIAGLVDMIGDFDKIKYFKLDSNLCAHQQNGITGCQRCIEVCATDAISSVNGQISVNPWLCQGCGDCSSVCPSGAISYRHPDLETTLQSLKTALTDHSGPVLFYSGETPEDLPADILPFQLEALGVLNLAIAMNAIAYGTDRVLIRDEKLTPESQQVLVALIDEANTLLSAMGFGERLMSWNTQNPLPALEPLTIPPARYQPEADKRRAIRMATDHLNQYSNPPASVCDLPQTAGFGRIDVRQSACTLCMACVSVCPAQALQSGSERPQLKFIEANCLQCRLCENACPEQAIKLIPRYQFDSALARQTELLYEEKPFLCINCQKPFASECMINAILQKLQHHPMFQGQRKQQLLLCEDCKIAAHFNDTRHD